MTVSWPPLTQTPPTSYTSIPNFRTYLTLDRSLGVIREVVDGLAEEGIEVEFEDLAEEEIPTGVVRRFVKQETGW